MAKPQRGTKAQRGTGPRWEVLRDGLSLRQLPTVSHSPKTAPTPRAVGQWRVWAPVTLSCVLTIPVQTKTDRHIPTQQRENERKRKRARVRERQRKREKKIRGTDRGKSKVVLLQVGAGPPNGQLLPVEAVAVLHGLTSVRNGTHVPHNRIQLKLAKNNPRPHETMTVKFNRSTATMAEARRAAALFFLPVWSS